MREARTARAWIRAALVFQFTGLVFDGVWHGLVTPGVEPSTFHEMQVHLAVTSAPRAAGV
jgi:hypothetical protein